MLSFGEGRPKEGYSDRSLNRILLERNRWEDGDLIYAIALGARGSDNSRSAQELYFLRSLAFALGVTGR